MFIEPIMLYSCPDCGRISVASGFITDPYSGDLHCGECDEVVEFHSSRKPEWFSVAIYEVSREYGGPEEGGWYYDAGTRVDETVRTFPHTPEGIEDAEKYLDSLHALRFSDRRDRWDSSVYTSRVYLETLPHAHFPRHRPVYC